MPQKIKNTLQVLNIRDRFILMISLTIITLIGFATIASGFVSGFSNQSPANLTNINTATPAISLHLNTTGGTYDTKQITMTIDGGTPINPTVSGNNPDWDITFTPTTPLKDGSHTVTINVANNADPAYPYTTTWSFNVAVPPVITKPAPNYTVTTNTPVISAYASDNTGLGNALLNIDNQSFIPTIDTILDRISYTPAIPLNDGTHIAVLTLSDLNGNSVSTQWTFSVDTNLGGTFTNMPVVNDSTCWQCHPNFISIIQEGTTNTPVVGAKHPIYSSCSRCHGTNEANNTRFNECTYCHYDNYPAGSPQYMSSRHKTDGSAAYANIAYSRHPIADKHLSSTTSCAGCHSRVLTDEHFRSGRIDKKGNPINCNTCHTGTYLGDETITNDALKLVKDQVNQVASTNPWYAPIGRTVSSIYIDHDINSGGYMRVFALYNSKWGLVYQGTGVTAKWLDLPSPTTALKTVVYPPYAYTFPNYWRMDVSKVILTANSTRYQQIQAAITNKDTRCEACHDITSTGHQHPVQSYETTTNVSCNSCHATDPIAKTTELSKMHLDKGYTCDTCHKNPAINGTIINNDGVMKVPNCSACHNDQIAKSADTRHVAHDIASGFGAYTFESGVNCSSCHPSLAINTIHEKKACDVCHTSFVTEVQGVIENNWSRAPFKSGYTCADCHNALTNKHNKLHSVNSYTADTADNSCQECHAKDVTTAHTKSTCDTCHGNTAPQDTKNTIAANLSTNITRVGYKCTDCHVRFINHSHNTSNYENTPQVACQNCHNTDPATKSTDLVKLHKSKGSCNLCHNPTFEGLVIIRDNNMTIPVCSTCHDAIKAVSADSRHASHDSASGYGTYNYDSATDCSSCHPSQDLNSNHTSTQCNLCHDSANFDVNKVIQGNWSRTVPKQGYTCADCHNSLPNKHSAEHLAQSKENVTCNGCHTFNNTTPINVSEIHSNCNTCHSATANMVTKDFVLSRKGAVNTVYSCEYCHGAPNGAKSHNEMHSVNAYGAGIADSQCLSCHNKDIIVVHNSATANCDTCHGATAPQKTKDIITANLSNNPNRAGYNCDSCHTNVNHLHPVTIYETTPQVDCATCHITDKINKTTELAQLHKNNCGLCHNHTFEGSVIIKDGIMNVPTCNTCHDGIKAKTKETVHTLHDSAQGYGSQVNLDGTSNSNCSLCHKSLALNDNHTKVQCNTCHSSTNTNIQYVIQGNLHTQLPKAGYNCDNCHSIVHTGWDTKHATTYVINPQVNCANCHTLSLNDEHNKWKTSSGTPIVCDTCHNSTNTAVTNAIANKQTTCDACHPSYHADLKTPHTSTYADVKQWDCSKCHLNVLQDEHNKWKTTTNQVINCNTCHDSINTIVKSAINNKDTRCTACHTVHAEITTPHLKIYFPDPAVDCLQCHSKSRADFDPAKASYHAVLGASKAFQGWGSYLNPWAYNSTMTCKDCHGPTNPGGTTASNHILKRPYEATNNSSTANFLCFMCHNSYTYGGSGTYNTTKSGFSSSSGYNNLHRLSYHRPGGISQCSWCHTTLPHGSDTPHLISTNSSANPQSKLRVFNHSSSGNYSESNCSTATGCH